MGKNVRHSGHRERVRKRYFDFGADSFHDHELLELALFYGIPRKNTNEIAHELLERFGDINGVFSADSKELTKINGIGESAATFIRLLRDICREYESFVPTHDSPEFSEDYPAYFRDCFTDTTQNMLLILCPSTNFRNMIPKEKLLNNSDDMIYITNQLIKMECSRLIIGINKTDSVAIPDSCDIALANYFVNKLPLFGIELIDFLIIGKKRSYSLIYDGAFKF